MSLSTNGHDYDLEKETIEFKSEDVGQEEGMLEAVENYFDNSDDITNATPDSLTSPGDVLNNEDPEWQKDCAEEDEESIVNYFDDDDDSFACTESEVIEEDEDWSEEYFDFSDDDEPQCDDTMTPSELPNLSRSEMVARIKENAARRAAEKANSVNKECADEVDDEFPSSTEPESVVDESSSEDFADYYSDIPLPDDSDAPPERYKSSSSNKSTNISAEGKKEDELPKSFSTNSDILGDYYGTYYFDKNNERKFIPLGRAIWLKDVIKNITDGTYSYEVTFKTEDGECKQTISKADAMNVRTLQNLCMYGADIPQKHVNTVVDSIRDQEENSFLKKQKCSFVHTDLGWHDPKNNNKPMFKATTSIGDNLPNRSKYIGSIEISHGGTYQGWKQMVEEYVLNHPALETILIAALSSVVVGLIGEDTTRESPILHFADSSSSGKTTSAMLAASVGGRPFQGSERNRDTGMLQNSLYQSWHGTVNAILGLQKGNMGFPIILDELSKVGGNTDLTALVYSFSDGTDKSRMNKDLEVIRTAPFRTSIISFGEISLLDKCKEKNDGLRLRVFELSGKLTDDAEHSRMIKKLCGENYGFALEKMATYILDNGGKKYVLDIYNSAITQFLNSIPVFSGADRTFEKFYAVYLTTCFIARKALEIKFHARKIFDFLNENLAKKLEKGTSAESAYERLLEKLRVNARNISSKFDEPNKNAECWGTYNEVSYVTDSGMKVIGEYSIRKNVFTEQLRNMGFVNKDTIIKDFKKLGYLNYENGRDTRRRKLGNGTAELCYVLRVFDVEASTDEHFVEVKPVLQVTKNQFGTYYTVPSNGRTNTSTDTPMKTLLA